MEYSGMQDMACLIKTDRVSYRYHDRVPALEEVSLSIGEGELVAVIGSNGSGKSTLLQILGGLIHPSEGSVFFGDREVSERTLRDRGFLKSFRERVGYVFQDSDIQLFCPTVLDELLYGPVQLGIPEKDALARAEEVMDMLQIANLRERPSYMLSGGEKKRVAIASVLTMNPDVLLFDEPTNGLDPRTQCFLVELLLALHDAGKTIVIATHDLSLVDELHARVAVLSEDHRIVATGDAHDILRDDKLLLTVNLIHEHIHFHGTSSHRHLHSHYRLHQHQADGPSAEILSDRELLEENHLELPLSVQKRTINKKGGSMNDIEKLRYLIEHWSEHNLEHAKIYQEWAGRAGDMGKKKLAETLNQIADRTVQMDEFFKEAHQLCQ
jgi:cobalt/nickel transport system ATP-binding protein